MEAPVKEAVQPAVANGDHETEEQLGNPPGTYIQQQNLALDVNGQMNPVMPPQQVYVNTGMHPSNGMDGLENQFQALGMNGPPEHLYDMEDDAGEPTDNDEEESEEDPVKLFVGQVRIFVGMGRVAHWGYQSIRKAEASAWDEFGLHSTLLRSYSF